MNDSSQLYQLIISQLIEDGYTQSALSVSEATMTPCPNQNELQKGRLSHLVALGLVIEKDKGLIQQVSGTGNEKEEPVQMDINEVIKEIRGVDFDSEISVASTFPNYQTKFITSHKNSCVCAKFCPDGKYVATGSLDTAIKVLDVEKMLLYGLTTTQGQKTDSHEDHASRPIQRTFYDHTACVNDIDFHPGLPLIASGSSDCSIKVFDFVSSSAKRAIHTFSDTHAVKSVSFHPTGDYILSSTDHTGIRLWDVETQKCYITPRTELNHFGPVNMVRYSSDGKLYVTCSQDGSIKFWDGVTNDCVNTITNAHGSLEVYSVQFSKNKKYLLTSGKDCTVRLWDVTAGGRQIKRIFCGNPKQPNQVWEHKSPATFTFNEDFIISPDETSNSCVVWDTRTGDLVQKLTGHSQVIRGLASSSTKPHIISCSDDHRARFWVEEATETTIV